MKNKQQFNKILIVRRDNIGDLLCTTPMLHALRQHYPKAHIAVLANSYNAAVLEYNPDIDVVYQYTKAKHSDEPKLLAWWKEWRLFRKLKKLQFDLLIQANPSYNPRNVKLTRYINPKTSLGASNHQHDYDIAIEKERVNEGHHVERVFKLLTPLGIDGTPSSMTLNSKQAESTNHDTVIGIHLSSRKPGNRWPESHYSKLIEELLTNGYKVHLFWAPGSQENRLHPGDDELAKRLKEQAPNAQAVATLTLASLINNLNQCNAIICPDGGTMHIAAALQKPLIALFGSTDPNQWGPWKTQSVVLNGRGKADNISIDSVINAIHQLRIKP